MGNIIQPSYSNRIKYTLRNDVFGSQIISEPIGWNEDEKEFKRSVKVHGVFTSLSNNLKFYRGDENNDGGFSYLEGVYQQQGINAEVLLIKEEKHPQTDLWQEAHRGNFDFSTRVIKDNQMSVKFKESSFYTSIQSRQNEKLELERLDTIDGDTISALETELVALNGREIFLVSQLDLATSFGNPILIDGLTPTNPHEARALPFKILSKSDDSVQGVTALRVDEQTTSYRDGTGGNMFYAISDKDNIFAKITINVNIDFQVTTLNGLTVRLDLITYENGTNYEFNGNFQTLKQFSTAGGTGNITYNDVLEDYAIGINESLCLAVHVTSPSNVNATYNNINLTIEEDSFEDARSKQSQFLLPFEVLERLTHIITGEENAVKSNFLGRTDTSPVYSEDGKGSLIGITHGLWIRGFDALPESDENKYKPITTSFKDFTESFESIRNTGYGVEKIGFSEFLRFEDKKYFYQTKVLISLPEQVAEVKRSTAKNYFYSAIGLGFKKPSGDNLYEEAIGLDEYNIRNSFTSIIKRIENKYLKESVYRGDSLAIEFAARKSILTNPTDDTRYDNDKFFMDLKRGLVSVFEQRLWQDDFVKAPTGIYSPETAQNLTLSPINTLIDSHAWWLRAGLNVYKNSFISNNSAIGNSKLTTQIDTAIHPEAIGKEYSESGKVQVKDLEFPLFVPEWIEFEHPVTTEIMQNVQGTTVIDGDKVMNYYGLVEFINENGLYEYGYLFELKPNKKGKWKLLKSTKKVAMKTSQPDPPISETDLEAFDYELNMEIDG